MEKKNYLPLHFQADFQYYFHAKEFEEAIPVYRTAKHPTKNAVVGMLGAVLGIPRKDPRLDELFNEIDIWYRTLREGTIYKDFQTGSQVDPIKNVEYLVGYDFEVYVGASDERLRQFYNAFRNPVWEPYFGKKCCSFPTAPIVWEFKTVSKKELAEDAVVHAC